MSGEWPTEETENEIQGLLADLGARQRRQRTERELVDEALAKLGVPPLTSETRRFTDDTEETP